MSTSFLKKYKVIQRVGEGSFSQVLKCQDRNTGLFYAGKRLKRIYKSISEIMESPEIIVMRKISRHPNILYMIEFHYDPLPGKVTLIFELMDMSLYDLVKNRKGRIIPEQKVRMYLYQLLKGLEHLHKHGVFHRDIKPENILVKDDVVKLADLGSIRGIYSRPPYTEYISTRWYRSPECLLTTGYYGPKMDVWALGCVFYELLTLKPLFPGCNEVDQITKIYTVLGTPHAKLIDKFQRHKSKNCEYVFPNKGGTGFNNLLPHVTEMGKELLKLMLVYDPESRSNVKKLLEHRYLNSFKQNNNLRQSSSIILSSLSQDSCQWRNNPVLLSYITSEKRRICKPSSIHRSKIMDDTSTKAPRIVTSSPINTRSNFTINPSGVKMIFPNKGDSTMIHIHESKHKSWRTNGHSMKIERHINESTKTNTNFSTKLPTIKYIGVKTSKETGDVTQKKYSNRLQVPFSSQQNLRTNDFYPTFKHDIQSRIFLCLFYCNRFLPQIIQKSEHHRPTAMMNVSAPQQITTQVDGGKRKTRLATINEAQISVPHTTSSNIKSPAKKIAKHETTTKSLGKLISTKKVIAPTRRLRGK
ncbi:hypothetical protein PV325_012187 [Microctonus aethiopoides]|nr:hypothetical protein PV325_012187 [Microctonus aethiopoides]